MFKNKKALKITAFVVGAIFLLGCGSGVVCARGFDKAEGKFYVDYQTDVDEDGTGKKTTRVYVDEAELISCAIEEPWPDCREDALDMHSRPMNEPLNVDRWKEKDENTKTVCVSSVSQPQVTVTNTWFIGTKPKTEKPAKQGVFERCMLAVKGATAYIKSEHHIEPSTILCSVWVWEKGKKKILDYALAQALGDCVSQAVVR